MFEKWDSWANIFIEKSWKISQKNIEKSVYKEREVRWLEGVERIAIGKCNGKRIGRLSDKSPSMSYCTEIKRSSR